MVIDTTQRERARLASHPAIKDIRTHPRPRFNTKLFETLQVESAEEKSERDAFIIFRFVVLHEYLNPSGQLHGAAQSLLYDVGTTLLMASIAREPNFWTSLGVSSSLNVTYLRPADKGEKLLMRCETVQVGRRLATLRGSIYRQSDGSLISTCEHVKYNVDADESNM